MNTAGTPHRVLVVEDELVVSTWTAVIAVAMLPSAALKKHAGWTLGNPVLVTERWRR